MTREAEQSDLLCWPLAGHTRVENEDVVIACVTLRRLLNDHPRVTEWQEAIDARLVAELEETGRINPDAALESAKQLCRELGLPSALIAYEICVDTWKRVYGQAENVGYSEIVWAAPANESEIRQKTDEFLVTLLRSAAEAVEGGFNAEIPWYHNRDSIKVNLAALATRVVKYSRTVDDQPQGRHWTNAELKAKALFRVEVGDEGGKRTVRQVADDLVRSKDLGPDPNNALRTVYEWLADMRRLLGLRPPTI